VFQIDSAAMGPLYVTVTAQNHRPYEGLAKVTNAPGLFSICPTTSPEKGGIGVTLKGLNFNIGTGIKVSIGGVECSNVNVIDASTLTCVTPPGTTGWFDVEVFTDFGEAVLPEGFRYFPTGGLPFNGTDVHTESLDAPTKVTLIASGLPQQYFIIYFSYDTRSVQTPYGIMGLEFPVYFVACLPLNKGGYEKVRIPVSKGHGPLDFYVHCLGQDANGALLWSHGGNNPNGSGSIWFHVNH
jgi:hypothetical protein